MTAALTLDGDTCRDLGRALAREWLETNGLGSFACGTVACANTRRYHAIVCVATRPPVGRMVLVDNLEAAVIVDGQRYELSTNLYRPDVVYPRGYTLLEGFRLDPWPIWTWRAGPVTVERELFMPHGKQSTVVRWRIGNGSAELLVRPLCSGRNYHATHYENTAIAMGAEVAAGVFTIAPYAGVPLMHAHHNGEFAASPEWFRRFTLPVEKERGLNGDQDLWSPGELRWWLEGRATADLVLTTESERPEDVKVLADRERMRRASLLALLPTPVTDDTTRLLVRAADQFLVARGDGSTVIAGYPWFTDWGRDTFIALPGLTLVTGRHAIARAQLRAFARHVSEGMIPNRFPDDGEAPEYNTVDASLWFAIAAGQYLDASGDEEFALDESWPAVRAIVEGYRAGTRYGIRVDDDGLVTAGAEGVQLTWMDAKIGDWVVTPRRGKPVEIQALWLRALAVAGRLATLAGDADFAEGTRAWSELARASFAARFWNEERDCLFDVIDVVNPIDNTLSDDGSLRPNQLYALAIDPPLLDEERATHALAAVEEKLLTRVGLRTLAPDDSRYLGKCTGGQHERDAAYHNGTVWPHLIGVYADAVWQVRRRPIAVDLPALLGGAGLGQVSEIFDGDEPHASRGCFAQAWAVAELLRLKVRATPGE